MRSTLTKSNLLLQTFLSPQRPDGYGTNSVLQVEMGGVKNVESYKIKLCEDITWWSAIVERRPSLIGPERVAAAPVIVPR